MKFITGNLLESAAEALVNTVNTVGVMGKGIALQFKEAFPNNYKAYRESCKHKELAPGKLLLFREQTKEGRKIIINFPTKTNWQLPSRYEYVEEGLKELVKVIQREGIKSIALPPLGCGNGGLDWTLVKPLMEQHLMPLTGIDVFVYEPSESIKAQLRNQNARDSKLTPARAILLYALYHYEAQGETVNLFVANKIAYLLQRLGATDFKKLKFEAHLYGPYSVGVEHMLYHINGKFLRGLEQRAVKAFENLELQYDQAETVRNFVHQKLDVSQKQILKALFNLISGFETAFSLELLATVDFIRQHDKHADTTTILNTVGRWSARKQKMFQRHYVEIAEQHLAAYESHFEMTH